MLIIKNGPDPSEVKVFKANAPPQGRCDNLLKTFKLLTMIKGKECIQVIDTIYEEIAEKSKQKMN